MNMIGLIELKVLCSLTNMWMTMFLYFSEWCDILDFQLTPSSINAYMWKRKQHSCLFLLYWYKGLTTFPWLYTRRNFFPKQEKVNRIKSFVYRILIIYSKTKLNSEIEFIRKILLEKNYLMDLMPSSIHTKIARFNNLELYCRENAPSSFNYHVLAKICCFTIISPSTGCFHFPAYAGMFPSANIFYTPTVLIQLSIITNIFVILNL